MNKLFGCDFLATSSKAGTGCEQLKEKIQELIISKAPARAESAGALGLSQRHLNDTKSCLENIILAEKELCCNRTEAAAMYLRAAFESISDMTARHIDQALLDNIFSRFCIGK